MDIETLETLKDDYPTSSWAVWGPTFPDDGCIEEDPAQLYKFIKQRRNQLRPSVVLLSLNPSTEMPSNYRNFHSTEAQHRNDQFRDLVEASGLTGAYMTDLVERIVDADPRKVDSNEGDIENLFEQLELLNQEEYHLLCFHEDVYDTLKETFGATSTEFPHDINGFSTMERGLRLHCYRVWFHANWGANRHKVPALENQLKYLSSNEISIK